MDPEVSFFSISTSFSEQHLRSAITWKRVQRVKTETYTNYTLWRNFISAQQRKNLLLRSQRWLVRHQGDIILSWYLRWFRKIWYLRCFQIDTVWALYWYIAVLSRFGAVSEKVIFLIPAFSNKVTSPALFKVSPYSMPFMMQLSTETLLYDVRILRET